MRELQELHIPCPTGHRRRALLASRRLLIAVGFLGAVFAAFACAVLLAHPAGASTAPNPDSGPVTTGIAIPTPPVVPSVTRGAVPDLQTLEAAVATPAAAAAVPAPVVSHLAAVTGPISQTIPTLTQPIARPIVGRLEPVISPVVGSLTQVLSLVSAKVSGVVVGEQAPIGTMVLHAAATTHSPVITDGLPVVHFVPVSAAGSFTHAPGRLPPFTPPSPSPFVTSGSPSGDAVSSAGGNALAVTPGSGLLLPDLAVSRLGPEQSRTPDLLFDVRHSPPG